MRHDSRSSRVDYLVVVTRRGLFINIHYFANVYNHCISPSHPAHLSRRRTAPNTETYMVLPVMQSVFGAAVGFLLGSAVHTTGLSPVYAAAGVVGVSRWYALLGVLVLFGTYMASGRPNVPFMEPVRSPFSPAAAIVSPMASHSIANAAPSMPFVRWHIAIWPALPTARTRSLGLARITVSTPPYRLLIATRHQVFGVSLCCGYAAGAVTGDRVNDGISALLFGGVGKP